MGTGTCFVIFLFYFGTCTVDVLCIQRAAADRPAGCRAQPRGGQYPHSSPM